MTLRAMGQRDWTTIGSEFKADVRWFLEYAREANGMFLMPVETREANIFCDSSLYGAGGHDDNKYYTWVYTVGHRTTYKDIHHLEAINVVVAYKTLAPTISTRPVTVCIWTDNMASSLALETGRTRDTVLAACAREIWLLAARYNQSVTIRHISGSKIPLADALSRASFDNRLDKEAQKYVTRLGLRQTAPVLDQYKFFSSFI